MITATRKGIPALGALTLFTALSGEFWPNLLGVAGAIILWATLSAVIALFVTRLGGWAKMRPSLLPKSLAAFVVLAVLSITWATDRGGAAWAVAALLALTLGAIFLATTFSWPALLAMLGRSTRLIVGLSIAFDLVAAIFVRQSIAPVAGLSAAAQITSSNLFTGGPILGIVGSADVLGAAAALGLVVVLLQRASGTVSRRRMLVWAVFLGGTLVLSGSWPSGTTLVITGATWGALRLARVRAEGHRGPIANTAAVLAIAGLAAILILLGRWPTLPAGLAALSSVGLVFLLGVTVSSTYRAWWLAADHQRDAAGNRLSFSPVTMLPLLLMVFASVYLVAGTTHGLTEVLPAAWLLLVLNTVKTKQDAHAVALPLAAVSGSHRDLPVHGFRR